MKLTKEQAAILLFGFRTGPGGELTAEEIMMLPHVMKKIEEGLQTEGNAHVTVELGVKEPEIVVLRKLWADGTLVKRDLTPRSQSLYDGIDAVTAALKE